MSLLRPLERLEAHVQAQNQEEEFWACRELVYDPRDWEITEEEAVARMQADELDRLLATGKIREIDRERVSFILTTIVYPLASTSWSWPLPQAGVPQAGVPRSALH
jgi:hypothetical protein